VNQTPRTDAWRRAYAPVILTIASLNLLDLTDIVDLPMPVPAMLFALNTVCFIRLLKARKADRHAAAVAAQRATRRSDWTR
jgi:hypothetical protein